MHQFRGLPAIVLERMRVRLFGGAPNERADSGDSSFCPTCSHAAHASQGCERQLRASGPIWSVTCCEARLLETLETDGQVSELCVCSRTASFCN